MLMKIPFHVCGDSNTATCMFVYVDRGRKILIGDHEFEIRNRAGVGGLKCVAVCICVLVITNTCN